MKSSSSRGTGEVRIIAGRLRGSKLPVADVGGLRPTSDRVRETVFNWLQRELPGCIAIDLFAGSGAMAFEAASRGAAQVVAIERDPGLASSLQASQQRLRVDSVQVICADALDPTLPARLPRADVLFLDPPFAQNLWARAIAAAQPLLKPAAWVYLEASRDASIAVPPEWRLHREGHTRDVRYALYRIESPAPADECAAPAATLPGFSTGTA